MSAIGYLARAARALTLMLVVAGLGAQAWAAADDQTLCVYDGDLNQDGTVSAGDAQGAFFIALAMLEANFRERCAADCNADGLVSAGDAQQAFHTALGMATCAGSCGGDAYEPDGSAIEATLLEAGDGQWHSLCPAPDSDYLRFTLAQPAAVRVQTQGDSGDTELFVFDAESQLVASDDDGGPGAFSLVDVALPAGSYFVLVTGKPTDVSVPAYLIRLIVSEQASEVCDNGLDDDGDGFIDCVDTDCAAEPSCLQCADPYEPDDGLDSAGLLVAGEVQVHGLCPVGDRDLAAFSLDRQMSVTLETRGQFGDPELWLLDADGFVVAYDDDSGVDGFSWLEASLSAGAYFVQVNDYEDDETIAAYEMHLDYGPELCANGLDDDGDPWVDCADPDCDGRDGCEYGAEASCHDEHDNDGDGLTDCQDDDCDWSVGCEYGAETTCDDAADNDGDGATDCQDADCAGLTGCEYGAEASCNDARDNDGNGLTDCQDEACAGQFSCEFGSEQSCADHLDNDGDGARDCADADCHAAAGCEYGAEASCADGFDNDGDGRADCADADCDGVGLCQFGHESACADGFDNDGDGLADCLDAQCAGSAGCELGAEQSCVDGFDNDGDGLADCLDADCDGSAGCEFDTERSCNDWRDNDGDGLADCLDADCDGSAGCEFGLERSCGDGFDNDGNGAADCPDPACDGIERCEFAVEASCGDDFDNDGDGDSDCLDADCAGVAGCEYGSEASCADDFDNDADLAADCLDPDCAGVAGCEYGGETSCADDFDNDADGHVDCADPDCASLEWCEPGFEQTCDDWRDNDGDGLTDCADDQCAEAAGCEYGGEHTCDDAYDNDGDGLVDCLDAHCDGRSGCEYGSEASCGDGADNDGDGLADCLDADCDGVLLCEFAAESRCGDGVDNDGDGLADCLDADCDGFAGCEFGAETACADGFDNDADGVTDCVDPDCTGIGGCEIGPEGSCGDALDNDGDGLTDCADADCDGLVGCEFGTEFTCVGGFDNDADGATDCQDADCDGLFGCEFGAESSCADAADNDGDGRSDCLDPDCDGVAGCVYCTRYVDASSPAAEPDGRSWPTAFPSVQAGIDAAFAAIDGVETRRCDVWVAGGRYVICDAGTRAAAVQLQPGVHLYGGFAGNEAERSARDWSAHETTLDGAGACYHVVVGADDSTLDGFVVTGGLGDGPSAAGQDRGAGMLNDAVSPLVANVRFVGNAAALGGAMANVESLVTVVNGVFAGNSAAARGGAMLNIDSSPAILNSAIAGNSAGVIGGGVRNEGSSPTVVNTILWDNAGGSLSNDTGTQCLVTYSVVEGGFGGAGNLALDPLFINLAAGNLRLRYDSPCIDRGHGDAAPEFDAAGQPRYDHAGFPNLGFGSPGFSDIGAFEFFPVADGQGCAQSLDCQGLRCQNGFCCPTGDCCAVPADCPPRYADGVCHDPAHCQGLRAYPTCVDFVCGIGALTPDDSGCGPAEVVADCGLYRDVTCNGAVEQAPPACAASCESDADCAPDAAAYCHAGSCQACPEGFSGPGCGVCVRFVNIANSAPGPNGLRWATAFPTVQAGIDAARAAVTGGAAPACEVWVAAGSYPICTSGTRTATVQLQPAVAVYGGFAGDEGARAGRDFEARPSVLDGVDLCYHVVTGANEAVLDGFTVTRGRADGTTDPTRRGGGMYNVSVSPTVRNCTFLSNFATYRGGGMYNEQSGPLVSDCTFRGNRADNTSSGWGGGMCNVQSSPTLDRVNFFSNASGYNGGGMFNYGASASVLTNCIFAGNTAQYGAGLQNDGSAPVLTNCVLFGNRATQQGGGLRNVATSNPVLTNCIVFGNTGSYAQIHNQSGTAVVTYSNIAGGYTGTGNFSADPQFAEPYFAQDFHLLTASPCVDRGNGSVAPAFDFEGDARFDHPGVVDQGAGAPSYSDVGADEFAAVDGSPCTSYAGCASGHCSNGICCATGECCREPSDCSGSTFTCHEPESCRGLVEGPACIDNMCSPATVVAAPDDSACGPDTVLIADCGLYAPVACTGQAVQAPPATACATTCASHADCLATAAVQCLDGTCQACPAGTAELGCATCVRYVDIESGAASPDGLGWATAFPAVQAGIDAARAAVVGGQAPTCEVWVAEGSYPICTAGTPTATVQLQPGVHVYGGFAGTEVQRAARDFVAHPTTLDGMLYCNHVVTGSSDASLDGFVVQRGRNGTSGGGISIAGSSPTIRHCTIRDNWAQRGGGVAVSDGSPLIHDCVIDGNRSTGTSGARGGGGLDIRGTGNTRLEDCIISANIAPDAGSGSNYNAAGIYLDANATVAGCTVRDNQGGRWAGGILVYGSGRTLTMSDTVVQNNANTVASYLGAGMALVGAAGAVLTRCTVSGNTTPSPTSGVGGIYIDSGSLQAEATIVRGNTRDQIATASAASSRAVLTSSVVDVGSVVSARAVQLGSGASQTLTLNHATLRGTVNLSGAASLACALTNSILWGTFTPHATACTVNRCDIQGGYAGSSGIDADPLFVDAANGDLRLQPGSPCVDAAAGLSTFAQDIAGAPRFDDPGVANTGTGLPPFADMGAYERQPRPAASSCTLDGQCVSGHCQNGFCCETGDCCAVPSDCPDYALVCDDSAACQGHREERACVAAMCGPTVTSTADDSACDTSVVVFADCGLYAPATCSGEPVQTAPACATSCTDTAQCDPTEAVSCQGGSCLGGCPPGFAGPGCSTKVRFVSSSSPGPVFDGLTWGTAFRTVQQGIDAATAVAPYGEVWVSNAGYSICTGGVDRTNTVLVKKGVQLYGGFGGQLTRQARPAGARTTLQGNNWCYHVVTGASSGSGPTVIDSFEIAEGRADGASSSQTYGGGLYFAYSLDSLTLRNCFVRDNEATARGAGLYFSGGGSVVLDRVDFSYNSALGNNPGELRGGGAFIRSAGPVTMTGMDFFINTAKHGGGLYVEDLAAPGLALDDAYFYANRTGDNGAGLYAESSAVSVANSTFYAGVVLDLVSTAAGGGAIYFTTSGGHVLTLSASTFTANGGNECPRGGAIYLAAPVSTPSGLVADNVTFNENVSKRGGGALFASDQSTANVQNSTFVGNAQDVDYESYSGGGALNLYGGSRFTNCVFVANWAEGQAGGAVARIRSDAGDTRFTNCTLYDNGCAYSDTCAILSTEGTALIVRNSILWNPSSIEIGGTGSRTVRYSDVDGGYSGTGNFNLNPRLSTSSQYRPRLLSDSPCIDRGDGGYAPATDREGLPRYDDPNTANLGTGTPNYTDVGAFEYVPVMPNGSACTQHSGCQSGHCENGYCCAAGVCCATAANCPAAFSGQICDAPDTCQGHLLAATCTDYACGTVTGAENDSACGSELVVIEDCDLYAPVTCTGQAVQPVPACATSCETTAGCNPNRAVYCQGGTCRFCPPGWSGFGCTTAVRFVDADSAAPYPNGLSWATAFRTVQQGIAAARAAIDGGLGETAEVWVAGGTYPICGAASRTNTVQLLAGVHVLGGFAGTEGLAEERDIVAHETVLDGQDECFHVVTGADEATLDGFTITGGRADGLGDAGDGGGMLNAGASPTVRNCRFAANTVAVQGAAMANIGSSPSVVDCVFVGNAAGGNGGAMANLDGAAPNVDGCRFEQNLAGDNGGAVANDGGAPGFTNCVFAANAAFRGGAMDNDHAAPVITNCTFADNTAESYGGAVYNHYISTPEFVNSILWGNGPDGIDDFAMSESTVLFCIVEGGWPGTGNVDADPRFLDPANGDYHLRYRSPAVDAADGDAAPAGDAEGRPRTDEPGVANRGTGNPNYADLGPYEFASPVPDGGDCALAAQCTSGHCQNGFCCAAGDCCFLPSDCPAAELACDVPETCQGHRLEPACTASSCGTDTDYFEDDSACGADIVLLDCGLYSPVTCTGDVEQTGDGQCATACSDDVDCNAEADAFCENGACVERCAPGWSGPDCDQCVRYVDGGSSAPVPTGLSWALAYPTVQGGITAARAAVTGGVAASCEVWVKRGTYDICTATTRTNTVQLQPAVQVYGGFAGTETTRVSRNWKTRTTRLHGQGYCYHVVTGASGATLDGFTIAGGNANGSGGGQNTGGGVYLNATSPHIENCTFLANAASSQGGAGYVTAASPSFTNCTFNGNSAAGQGGALYLANASTPNLTNVVFAQNTAVSAGGALYAAASSPLVANGVFRVNTVTGTGAGGGAFAASGGTHTFYNCTFYGNTSAGAKGGIYVAAGSASVTNGILWGNTPVQVSVDAGATATVTHSDVQGGYAGSGNINSDPLFVAPAAGDLHLQVGSPCIDRGNGSVAPASDIEGRARYDLPAAPNGIGIPPYVDFGAFEYTP